MAQCIESIEPLFGQKSDTLIFSTGFTKIHMSSKMSYDHKLLDPWFLTHFAFCVISTFEPQRGFTKKRRNANQRSQCSGHNGQQPQVAPVKVRVHPAVAILLAVGKGLTKKQKKTPNTSPAPPRKHSKNSIPVRKLKIIMLVCKVKMLGEKRKKQSPEDWKFPSFGNWITGYVIIIVSHLISSYYVCI